MGGILLRKNRIGHPGWLVQKNQNPVDFVSHPTFGTKRLRNVLGRFSFLSSPLAAVQYGRHFAVQKSGELALSLSE